MIDIYIYITLAFNIFMAFGIDPLDMFYIIYFFLLFMAMAEYVLYSDLTIRINFIDLMPLIMVLIWYYGLILGVANHNNKYFALRNFFGMNLYLFYYVLKIRKVSTQSIIRVLLYASATILVLSLVLFFIIRYLKIDAKNPILELLVGRIFQGSSTGKGRIWFMGQVTVFILMALSFSRILTPKSIFKKLNFQNRNYIFLMVKNLMLSILIFSACCFIVFFMTDSAGNSLAGICILLSVALCLFVPKILRGRIHFGSIFFILVGAVLAAVLIKTAYSDIIVKIFTRQGNLQRIAQIKYLIDDLTLFGNGLGATIPGYLRNEELPYGFELIYLNFFHKFGIFAVLIMLNYFLTFFIVLKKIMTSPEYEKKLTGFVCLGSLAYLFITIGNPIALSNVNVLLHCIVLYIIRNEFYVGHQKQPVNHF